MKYETCEKCPIKDTCNLIKMGIEERCTLNGGNKWTFEETKKVETYISFDDDVTIDDFEPEID